jgi:hypothetical protein
MSAFAHLYTSATHVRDACAWCAPKRRLKDPAEADLRRKKKFSPNGARAPFSDRFAQKCANLRDVYRAACVPRSAQHALACNRKPIEFRVEFGCGRERERADIELRYRSTSASGDGLVAHRTFRVLARATPQLDRRVAEKVREESSPGFTIEHSRLRLCGMERFMGTLPQRGDAVQMLASAELEAGCRPRAGAVE